VAPGFGRGGAGAAAGFGAGAWVGFDAGGAAAGVGGGVRAGFDAGGASDGFEGGAWAGFGTGGAADGADVAPGRGDEARASGFDGFGAEASGGRCAGDDEAWGGAVGFGGDDEAWAWAVGFGGDDEVAAPRPWASPRVLDWLADGDRAGGCGRVSGVSVGAAATDCPGD
jgi:hypothetical protein